MSEVHCENVGVAVACRRCGIVVCGVVGIFLAIALPLILSDHQVGRGYFDERDYHHVAIQRFARQWPHLDFSDYESMTTPGYHVVLAGALRAVGDNVRLLRLVGLLFTLGLLATSACATGRFALNAADAIALCLPLVGSLYVISSGIWLLPDNAAWWCVLGVVLVALRNRWDLRTCLVGGIVLLLLVWMRQIHLWAAAVLWASAWIGRATKASQIPPLAAIIPTDWRAAARRTAWMLLATMPAFATVYAFYRVWGGFTVPMYQYLVAEPSWAAPAMVLALFACFGIFYIGYCLPRWREIDRRTAMRVIVFGLIVGALVGVLPATSFDPIAERRSGIWNLVRFAPVLADRSVLMMALSTLGGGLVAFWFAALGARDRWIFLTALLAFTAAQVPGARVWQRYYEPFLLIVLAVFAARMTQQLKQQERMWKWRIAGPAALAMLLGAVTYLSLTRGSVI